MTEHKKPTKTLPEDGDYSISGHFAQADGEFDNQDAKLTEKQPYEKDRGVRVESELPQLSGYQEIVRFGDEFFLTINDRKIEEDFFEKCIGEGWLTLHFRLEGKSDETYGDLAEVERSPSYCYIVMQPEGLERGEWLCKGTELKTVAITFKPNFLNDILGLSEDKLPELLRNIVSSKDAEFIFQPIPIDGGMNYTLREFFHSPYSGDVRRIMFQAKVFELIGMIIFHLQNETDEKALPVRLSPRDIELLQHAREIIQERYQQEISIQELSKEIGLNRNKLQYGCKYLFNTTVNNLHRQARMDKACELLEKGESNISIVAEKVGYTHPSSFTTVFRKFYGTSPRNYTRRHKN